MENFPRTSAIGQLFAECMSDTKSRFQQMGNQSVPRDEVICPKPQRATKVPDVTNSLNRFSSKPIGSILSVHKGDSGLDFLDILLSEEVESEGGDSDGSCRMGFFSGGSPPARTNNPVVHDARFAKQTLSLASILGNCNGNGMKPPARVERGSPTCASSFGTNPKVRVEGFASGSPGSPHCAMPALA